MADAPPQKSASGGLLGRLRSRLQPVRELVADGVNATVSGMLSVVGLDAESKAPPVDAPAKPHAAPPSPAPLPRAPAAPAPLPRAPAAPGPLAAPVRPPSVPVAVVQRGPTPVQVMTAVQHAVSGAAKVVSGTIDGVRAAGAAVRAASATATGASAVASGVATVASGFFPQLAALGIGVSKTPKAPKSRPGMRPQRRVADIIANPMGSSPKPAPAPDKPVRRVQRVPMVRPKSSLELGRRENRPKPRSYADLQMRPQLGLSPHEILLKVATITLGKTLIGFLESGARSQQAALQRVSARMSEKQLMLLGMLPAQYIAQRLPVATAAPVPTPTPTPTPTSTPASAPTPTPASSRPSSNPASPVQPGVSSSASGALKFRY